MRYARVCALKDQGMSWGRRLPRHVRSHRANVSNFLSVFEISTKRWDSHPSPASVNLGSATGEGMFKLLLNCEV